MANVYTKKRLTKQNKCSPMIWRKLSIENQRVWSDLYDLFFDKSNFPPGWDSKLDSERQGVVAHNLACQVVWYLKSKIEKKK